jgi:hypothetical protein
VAGITFKTGITKVPITLTFGNRTVMTSAASTDNLIVIHIGNRSKGISIVASIARITRICVISILTDCDGAVVAVEAITINFVMINLKYRRKFRGVMAGLTAI